LGEIYEKRKKRWSRGNPPNAKAKVGEGKKELTGGVRSEMLPEREEIGDLEPAST